MKVRLLGNSIRFRLKKSEVTLFKKEGAIKQMTQFGIEPGDILSFVIRKNASEEFKLKYRDGTVTVDIPEAVCCEWTDTNLVGFEEEIDTGKGQVIKILIEKDFQCLHTTDIENLDSYPNPNLNC